MKNWVPVEEFLAEFENDPRITPYLAEARRRLAPILYPEGGPQYDRLMRGEPPPVNQSSEPTA